MRTKVYAKWGRARVKISDGWDGQNDRDWEKGNTVFHLALSVEYD